MTEFREVPVPTIDQTAKATDENLHSPKTSTMTYAEYLEREHKRAMTPTDRLLEYEIEEQMDIQKVPMEVLEAELKRRRKANLSEADSLTDDDFDKMSAEVFGREVKETKATDDDDLDARSAKLFGRRST